MPCSSVKTGLSFPTSRKSCQEKPSPKWVSERDQYVRDYLRGRKKKKSTFSLWHFWRHNFVCFRNETAAYTQPHQPSLRARPCAGHRICSFLFPHHMEIYVLQRILLSKATTKKLRAICYTILMQSNNHYDTQS